MNIIKKLALFVCIALTPVKSSAVGLGDFVGFTINAGVTLAIPATALLFLDFCFGDKSIYTTGKGKAVLGGLGVAFIGCTLHTGRVIYRFFKSNQKNN